MSSPAASASDHDASVVALYRETDPNEETLGEASGVRE
jgi:hypothetical protein